jgi:hypothetical protein
MKVISRKGCSMGEGTLKLGLWSTLDNSTKIRLMDMELSKSETSKSLGVGKIIYLLINNENIRHPSFLSDPYFVYQFFHLVLLIAIHLTLQILLK